VRPIPAVVDYCLVLSPLCIILGDPPRSLVLGLVSYFLHRLWSGRHACLPILVTSRHDDSIAVLVFLVFFRRISSEGDPLYVVWVSFPLRMFPGPVQRFLFSLVLKILGVAVFSSELFEICLAVLLVCGSPDFDVSRR